MKKTLVTVLVLSLIVALSACGELATIQQKPTTPTTAATQPETKQPETPATVAATQPQQQTQPQTQPAQPETKPEAPETAPPTQPEEPETVPPTQPATAKEVQTQPATEQIISRERAVEIALQSAGLTEEAVSDLEAELDKERNGLYWEVSFETARKEYDCDIHAYNGTVVKVETEKEEERPTAQPTTPPTQPVQTQAVDKKAISRDKAVEIALNAAGLKKTEVKDLEAELDKERNGLYWEVSFETAQKEYDYEIHAYDGTVTRVETEKEDQKPVATEPVKPAISKSQAVEIALKAAGLKKADVAELETELDEERRVPVWEVSFETRQVEYSYEINAENGKIVKSESERND